MADPSSAPAPLSAEAAARLADFARACKAAARAVSLYPGAHPAIDATLGRLATVTAQLTETGPFRLEVVADQLLIGGAAMARPDSAITELAALLHRHLIGGLNVNAGANVESWRTLLLLLARPAEDVRADGGIARLWATAGGPSLEILEIDYAEVLREKQGLAATIASIVSAALAGPQLRVDDATMTALLDIVKDPEKLDALMQHLQKTAGVNKPEIQVAAFISILRTLAEHAQQTGTPQLDAVLRQMGHAARRFSPEGMLALVAERSRPEAVAAGVNVAAGVIQSIDDPGVAEFVARSVVAERGASGRLAHAFRALVPEMDRQRQLLALARIEVQTSDLGAEAGFDELWQGVERMVTSYSDSPFVSDGYARELTHARTQPVEVERTSDDPPERISEWLATVNDIALHDLDRLLLVDLLGIEEEPLRWRDIAGTVVAHADDLVRVGHFDQAWQLVEVVVDEAARIPARSPHATDALGRFGRGPMMKHVATHLRGASDESYERFKRLCHAIGPSAVAPLAEVLSAEQDARSRRRLRDILVGFGSRGREAVQQLMSAQNWEVRRTAAFLLREFGGAEGLQELIPLLADTEPLVQREAVQGLVLNGSAQAADILMRALQSSKGRTRERLITELVGIRDDRAAPFFGHLVRHLDRRSLPQVYLAAIDALGAAKSQEAIDALASALRQGEWWRPVSTRRFRGAAAQALRRIGSAAALETLRQAASQGPRGARSAARAQLAGSE